MTQNNSYQEIKPIEKLSEFIHSFWKHENVTDNVEDIVILPDSYFKIVFNVRDGKVLNYFLTGLWIKENVFSTPPHATNYGCRLKILAPEFLLNREVSTLIQNYQQLDLSFLNLRDFGFSSFENIVQQWQKELLRIKPDKEIPGNKLRLSQLLYEKNGDISAAEVSAQIFWTNRQINRYMNKYLGVSLKRYLNLQKVYYSYKQIREGRLFPENYYFDQAHFIKEVKKHTGHTPTNLHKEQNDRFLQLKNIKQK